MTDRSVIRDRMEAIGETEMRRQLQAGNVPANEIAFVQLWLGEKEAARKQIAADGVSAARDQANHAATANILSAAALLISVMAAIFSLFALFRS